MGCFLACFGSSKDKKGRHHGSAGARDHRRGNYSPVQQQVAFPNEISKAVYPVAIPVEDFKVELHVEGEAISPTILVTSYQNEAVDEVSSGTPKSPQHESSPNRSNLASPASQGSRSLKESANKLSSMTKKKVSFNTVVKTYEPVDRELLDELSNRERDIENVELGRSSASPRKISSDEGSNSSSVGSYPPNHRYQNCRESDDEDEELDYGESDLGIEDDEDDLEEECVDGEYVLSDSLCSMESSTRVSLDQVASQEVDSEKKFRATEANMIARCRDASVHSVLNPVENLSQWKALKARGQPPQQTQKENFALDLEESRKMSFSKEPHSQQAAHSSRTKSEQNEHRTQQIAVDASLSNWLATPQPANKTKTSTSAIQNTLPQRPVSQGSYSPQSFDDRPILGALTLEELRLMSRSASPRRSPTKSPDDMAIIGSVGSYWSREKSSDKDSGSVSSYKGIPNTTSKYREDKQVNWHSTPFETRLEKALNIGSAEA